MAQINAECLLAYLRRSAISAGMQTKLLKFFYAGFKLARITRIEDEVHHKLFFVRAVRPSIRAISLIRD